MWNGNQQYPSQIPTRLDFSNQIQQQRLPSRQSSSQYSQPINNTVTTNTRKTKINKPIIHRFNKLVPQNDRWINLPWTDPAIISHGNKLDTTSTSQWSTNTQSQGSSTISSGNNLMSNPRWSQQQQQPQSHMLTNGIYMPYSTTSGVDDGNRS
jgi:hypothetical protein